MRTWKAAMVVMFVLCSEWASRSAIALVEMINPAATQGSPGNPGVGIKVPAEKYFYVYSDVRAEGNHFAPSGFMGDFNNVKIKDYQQLGSHSGTTSIRFTYTPTGLSQDVQWSGVQWQNPEGNWGSKNGGFDLTGAKRLTFWAKGKTGDEMIDKFQIGGVLDGNYPDSDSESIGPIKLTQEWRQYTIDLTDTNMSYIGGGFLWAASTRLNPKGITFYLDDIRYEFE